MVTTTKSRTPAGSGVGTGTGAKYIVDATQIPTARTFDEAAGRANRMDNVDEWRCTLAHSDTTKTFVAAGNGRIDGLIFVNASTACDGTNGWKMVVTNPQDSNHVLASFGAGTATNAAAAVDTQAVAASVSKFYSNSAAYYFTKGDRLTLTLTEDGTAGAADLAFVINYQSTGH